MEKSWKNEKLEVVGAEMETIELKKMTRELCHELYKDWNNDESIYMDMSLFKPFCYSEASVNRYFDLKKGNPQSNAFWRKNGFIPIDEDEYICMELVM